jgi:hypothetical protein
MFIGLRYLNYLHPGESFFAEVRGSKNSAKRRAVDRIEPANKFRQKPKNGRDQLNSWVVL